MYNSIEDIYQDTNLKFLPYPYCPLCEDKLTIYQEDDKLVIACPACGFSEISADNIQSLIYDWNHHCHYQLGANGKYSSRFIILLFILIILSIICSIYFDNFLIMLAFIFIGPPITIFISNKIIDRHMIKIINAFKEKVNSTPEELLTINVLIDKLQIYQYSQIKTIINILIKMKTYKIDSSLERLIINDSYGLLNAVNIPINISTSNKKLLNDILNKYINIYQNYLTQVKEYNNDSVTYKLKAINIDATEKINYLNLKK